MIKKALWIGSIGFILGSLLSGCGADAGDAMRVEAPPSVNPNDPVKIEESDLYRLKGDILYVQNSETGLNIIDVKNLEQPKLLGQAPVVGKAGELYLRSGHAVVLLESATGACQQPADCYVGSWGYGSEIVMVDLKALQSPRVIARYCLPGSLVASRAVNDFLFVVTSEGSRSQVLSLDITDPARTRVVQQMDLSSSSKEIHVTEKAIFIAGPTYKSVDDPCPDGWCSGWGENTEVKYVEINATSGAMKARGSVVVAGETQGRFHMQAYEDQFRIVTFAGSHSVLHVIDVENPDVLARIGSLGGIGSGEQLYATRFDGDRAYVVTFRQTDPLWVIDLSDPSRPQIVGELHVPGWSDFIFPRGDKLLCVGRGDGGWGLGVSLFDVSDPRNPRAIDQLSFGMGETASEANLDHRAVTIIEADRDQPPLLIVPYTSLDNRYSNDCKLKNNVQLVDVNNWSLRARGAVLQEGKVRRTLLVRGTLLSISDYELLSIDLSDRDRPAVRASLIVGTAASLEDRDGYWGCYPDMYYDDYDGGMFFPFGCNVSSEIPAAPTALLALLALVFLRRRSR